MQKFVRESGISDSKSNVSRIARYLLRWSTSSKEMNKTNHSELVNGIISKPNPKST